MKTTTKRNRTTTTLIDHDSHTGQYDMTWHEIIVDTPKNGRVYLREGFGGMGDLCGGMYRWRHGLAIQLLPGDTLQSLRDTKHNDIYSVYEAMLGGHRSDRPMLEWTGCVISGIAASHGF